VFGKRDVRKLRNVFKNIQQLGKSFRYVARHLKAGHAPEDPGSIP
jgi:hypothetical protein